MLHRGSIVLDRYEVQRLVARGAMGIVYAGVHRWLQRPVAIKVLKEQSEGSARQRFEREAHILAQIEHPHIVSILDFGFLSDDRPCIVMELLDGDSVEATLTRQGVMSWASALSVVAQVLSGLDALHSRHILHRDLKTANLVWVGPEAERVKLIDLGIARGQDELGVRLTRTGVVMGSPAYMAPELLCGEQATVASELYAVGLILYELLEGQLPFGSHTFAQVMRRVDEPVEALTRPAPVALSSLLIHGLLARDPAKRPGSAREAFEILSTLAAARQIQLNATLL